MDFIGPLTRKQMEDLWTKDRMTLVECFYKHRAQTEYYKTRDGLIMKGR